MTTFDGREKAFEDRFAHDQELQFKVTARRNKLLGLWLARQLGKTAEDAEAYAKEVVLADFDRPGDDDVIEKIVEDAAAGGISLSPEDVRAHMQNLLADAKKQVFSEVP
jgi:hypothetical protein